MAAQSTAKKEDKKVTDSFPNDILTAEFEYAKETAAQAMDDRHKMVNYYLIIVGIFANAIGMLLTGKMEKDLFGSLFTKNVVVGLLLFLIFIIGVLYLLKLIRLRSAWFESALCMNQIKDYYNEKFPEWELKGKAFRWTKETLIRQHISKLSTLFGYSALLIILLNSVAFFAFLVTTLNSHVKLSLIYFIVVFILQIIIYKSALSDKRLAK